MNRQSQDDTTITQASRGANEDTATLPRINSAGTRGRIVVQSPIPTGSLAGTVTPVESAESLATTHSQHSNSQSPRRQAGNTEVSQQVNRVTPSPNRSRRRRVLSLESITAIQARRGDRVQMTNLPSISERNGLTIHIGVSSVSPALSPTSSAELRSQQASPSENQRPYVGKKRHLEDEQLTNDNKRVKIEPTEVTPDLSILGHG